MNKIAQELNKQLNDNKPVVLDLLSPFGKEIFFPKGILSQSGEAKMKAHKFNATIGIAKENNESLCLKSIYQYFNGLKPNEIFPYAPSYGLPELRKKWQELIKRKNTGLQDKDISLPIVTSGITNGLSIIADLFVDSKDSIIVSSKIWGNYKLIFNVRKNMTFTQYNTFANGTFDIDSFRATVENYKSEKVIILFNFPNNPTGYNIEEKYINDIRDVLLAKADVGHKLVMIYDDAYFGLNYFDNISSESLFSHFADLHDNILNIKLDAPTKEDYVWGFRIGFITYNIKNGSQIYDVLEKKTAGCIRSMISNCSRASQQILLKAFESDTYQTEKAEKYNLLKDRALKSIEIVNQDKYKDYWEMYPFNSGYFFCIKLKKSNAETLRVHLLDKYGIGTIAINDTDLRIAISCLEKENIEKLIETIYLGIKDISD